MSGSPPTPARPGDARLTAAVVAGQLAAALSRRLGRGGGTTLPGEVARRIDPAAPGKIARQLRLGSIVVTGTNGKTTTTRLIASILAADGRRVVHNRSGANLVSGVTSALIRATHPSGRIPAHMGLFEVDEASVPPVVESVRPRVLAVNNLFRDQLDRYGEVAYVAKTWRRAVERLDEATTLVLNADDPSVAALGRGAPGPVIYVGVDDPAHAQTALEHTADARLCPVCGSRLLYAAVYYGHLGHYRCPGCGFARPTPTLSAARVETVGPAAMRATLGDGTAIELPLPGLYNVYNALVALGTARAVGVPDRLALQAMARFSAAFGRIERIQIGDRTAYMALVKNPVGFNQVLRSLLASPEPVPVLIAINDNLADGTDVSWLWDVDFDAVRERAAAVMLTGTRAEDMLTRLKYADVPLERIRLLHDPAAALDQALAAVPAGGVLYVMPTYTAMLEIRGELSRRGLVAPFWED